MNSFPSYLLSEKPFMIHITLKKNSPGAMALSLQKLTVCRFYKSKNELGEIMSKVQK